MPSEEETKALIKDICKREAWEELANIDVSSIQNFSEMFKSSSIPSLEYISNWDMSNATNLSLMFFDCRMIKSLEPLKYWNVSNVKNFSWMFTFCINVENPKGLENWDVSKGINFSGMFMFQNIKYSEDTETLIKHWNNENADVIKISKGFGIPLNQEPQFTETFIHPRLSHFDEEQ